MRRGVFLGALLLAGCVTAKPEPPSLRKAEEFFLQGQFSRAAGLYEDLLAAHPDDPRRPEILLRVGKCRLGAGQADLAIRAFDGALAAPSPPPPVRGETMFRRAVALRMTGDFRRAVEGFRAAAADPACPVPADELNYEFATTLFRVGEWKEGQERLAAVSPRGPFGPRARVARGLSAFTVQVGAFEDEERARTLGERLGDLKLAGMVRRVEGFHIVSAGSFARSEEAQREAERLKAMGFRDAFVVP